MLMTLRLSCSFALMTSVLSQQVRPAQGTMFPLVASIDRKALHVQQYQIERQMTRERWRSFWEELHKSLKNDLWRRHEERVNEIA